MEFLDVAIYKLCILSVILLVTADQSQSLNNYLCPTRKGEVQELSSQSSVYTPPVGLDLPNRREPGGTR